MKSTFYNIAIVTVMSVVATGVLANGEPLKIKSHVSVTQDFVLLKDVVENLNEVRAFVGDRMGIKLMRSPAEGQAIRYQCEAFQNLIRTRMGVKKGSDEASIEMACETSVQIERKGRPVEEAKVQELIATYLKTQQGMGNREFRVVLTNQSKIQVLTSASGLSVERIVGRIFSGSLVADFWYWDGNLKRRVSVPFRLETYQEVARLREVKPQGQAISEADVDYVKVNTDGLRCQTVVKGTRFLEMQAKRNLEAGEFLCWEALDRPELVKKGDFVTITLEHGQLHLMGRGRAMESGKRGDVIRLENVDSKKSVYGQVTDQQQVRIVF